jgi:hypothetical protein
MLLTGTISAHEQPASRGAISLKADSGDIEIHTSSEPHKLLSNLERVAKVSAP